MYLLIIICMFNYATGASEPCLFSDKASGLCYLCSPEFFLSATSETSAPFPESLCIRKEQAWSERRILVRSSLRRDCPACLKYFDFVYDNLLDALSNESILLKPVVEPALILHLEAGEHHIALISGKQDFKFFRHQLVNITIKPVMCSEFQDLNVFVTCAYSSLNTKVYVKTDSAFLFVNKMLSVWNISFIGTDMRVKNASLDCKLQAASACCGALNEPSDCMGPTYFASSNNRPLGLINLELYRFGTVPEVAIISCEFKDFVAGFDGISSLLRALCGSPFKIAWDRTNVIDSALKLGLLFTEGDQEEAVQFNEFFFENVTALENISVLIVQNSNFSGTLEKIAIISKSNMLEQFLFRLRGSHFKTIEFTNITFDRQDLFINVSRKAVFFTMLKGTWPATFRMSNIVLQRSALEFLSAVNSSALISIFSLFLINCSFSKSPVLSIYSASLDINSFLVKGGAPDPAISADLVSADSSQLSITSMSYERQTFTFSFKKCNTSLRSVSISGQMSTISPFLLYLAQGVIEITDSFLNNISLLSKGAVMVSATGSSFIFKRSLLTAISCFTLFDLKKMETIELSLCNLTQMNSIFTIFGEQCTFVYFKLSNSNIFSNKFNHFFIILNPLLFSSPSPVMLIDRLTFSDHIMNSTLADFFSAFSKVNLRITSCQFENMRRLKHITTPPYAIFFVSRGASLDIYNTSFNNVGFAYEPIQMNVLYNYPLILVSFTIYINISYSYFSIDETLSLQGFLFNSDVITYVSITNNVFIARNPQPQYAYRAFISIQNPVTYLINNTFSKITCFWKDVYLDYLTRGSLYIYGYTLFYGSSKAYVINKYFRDCFCYQGGGMAMRFLEDVYIAGNIFESTRAFFGGTLYLQQLKNLSLSNNTIFNSFGNISGIIHSNIIENLVTVNCSFFSSSTEQGSALYLIKVSGFRIEWSLFCFISSLKNGGVFLLENSNLIITNSSLSSLKSLNQGGMFFLDFSSNLTMSRSNVSNCSANYGGVGFINLGVNLLITDSIFRQIESTMHGGVFYFDLISKGNFSNNFFFECSAATGGAILIKTNDEASQFFILNTRFYSVRAKLGSCLYFSSPSDLTLINVTIVKAAGDVVYLKWEFIMEIQVYNFTIELSSAEGALFYVEGLAIDFKDILIKNNVVGKKLLWFRRSVFSGEKIMFTENVIRDQTLKPYCLLLERSSFNAKQFYFSFLSNSDTKQGAISSILQSQVLIANATMIGGWADGIIYFENSQVVVEGTVFISGKGSAIYNLETNLNIYQGSFFWMVSSSEELASAISVDTKGDYFNKAVLAQILIEGNSSKGPAILFKGVEEISIENSYIKNSQQGILVFWVKKISVGMCSFEQISGPFKGSAISVINRENSGSLSISNSNFLKCISYDMAGAIYTSYLEAVDIFKTTFKENEAQGRGAVGVLLCDELESCLFVIRSSGFYSNYAVFIAPLFLSNVICSYDDILVEDNKDGKNFTEGMSFFPVNVLITNPEKLHLVSGQNRTISLGKPFFLQTFNEIALNISSGQPFSLHFTLFDSLNQTLLFEDSASATLKIPISNTHPLSLQPCVAKSNMGNINLDDCVIKGPPNSFTVIQIVLKISGDSILSKKDKIIEQTLKLFLRPCTRDEVQRFDFSCNFCSQSSYADPSLPEKCAECPANAICPGGWRAFPASGFWRAGNTTKFARCFIEDACLGYISKKSDDENYRGNCLEGHFGLLCHDCENGFGKMNPLATCKPCNDVMDVLRLSAGCFLLFIYIIGVSYSYSLEVKSKIYYNQLLAYSKILFTFMQITNLLIFFKFSWVLPTFQQILSISNNIIITTEDILLNDCLFKKSSIALNERYAYKVLTIIFFPLIFFVITATFWTINILIERCRHRPSGKKSRRIKKAYVIRNLASLITAIFVFHPLITKACFNLFNCILVDGSEGAQTYLFIYPNFECWTEFHYKIISGVAVPGTLVWGFGFPLLLLMLLLKQRSMEVSVDLSSPDRRSNPTEGIKVSTQIFVKSKASLSIALDDGPVKEINRKKRVKSLTNVMIKKQILDFLYIGYRPEFIYWECLIFFKKFLLSILINLQYIFGMNLTVLLVLLVQAVHLQSQMSIRPYLLNKMNQLETASVITSSFIFIIAVVLTLDLANNVQLALNFTIVLAYLFFLAQGLFAVGFLLKSSRLPCMWWGHFFKKLKSREPSNSLGAVS